MEELLAERGIDVDPSPYSGGCGASPLFIDAARPCRHAADDRWFVDETSVKVAGRWTHLYRAVDQFSQVMTPSGQRDLAAAGRFFRQALVQTP